VNVDEPFGAKDSTAGPFVLSGLGLALFLLLMLAKLGRPNSSSSSSYARSFSSSSFSDPSAPHAVGDRGARVAYDGCGGEITREERPGGGVGDPRFEDDTGGVLGLGFEPRELFHN
jgi:hypothetical protein